ncbi:MAG: hypothetical protein JXB85_00395 [Anaerolineales bacterium]|nr:hypothetical protein [Anaerolineales bacterium]
MNRRTLIFVALSLAALLLGACGGDVTATPVPRVVEETEPVAGTPTAFPTPDPCAAGNLAATVEPVNHLMREFDDAATLASQTPREQLVQVIPSLQEVRRRAEDLDVPSCLATLKALEVTYMNSVINTLIGFLGGADSEAVVQGVALARLQREDYNRELSRLLGMTYAPAAQPTAAATVDPASGTTPPAQTTGALVTNNAAAPVNLRTAPDLFSETPGMLASGESLPAVGITADGLWVAVVSPYDPTQLLWIYAELVTISDPALPVITP